MLKMRLGFPIFVLTSLLGGTAVAGAAPPVPPPTAKSAYTITLTLPLVAAPGTPSWQTVMKGLRSQPYDEAAPIIATIIQQGEAQDKPPEAPKK